jgi:hypothetical protein
MTIIKLLLEDSSNQEIRNYLLDRNLPIKNEYHTTLLYSEEFPVFKRRACLQSLDRILPITLDPSSYEFAMFGQRDLVLRYNAETVVALQDKAHAEAVRQMICEWPNLNARERQILCAAPRMRESTVYPLHLHITFVKNFIGDMNLPPFTAPLRFVAIEWTQNYSPIRTESDVQGFESF